MRSSLLGLLLLISATGPAAADCSLTWHSTIPLLMQGNLATVPAEINGTVVGMIVDTGAWTTTVTPTAAREIGLRPIKDYARDTQFSGVGGAAFYEIDAVQTLSLGGVTYRNIPVLQSELGIGARQGELLAGVLGFDLLSHYDLALDEPAATLGLYTAPAGCGRVAPPLPGTWRAVAIDTDDAGHLDITVTINGRPVRAILDTGASGALIGSDAAARVGLGQNGPSKNLRAMGAETPKATVQRADTLGIGNMTLHDVPILVTKTFSGVAPGTEMLLGSTLLSRVPVLISYRSHTLWLGDPAPAPKH